MKLGEFDFIAELRKAFPEPSGAVLGIGDDCAVLPFGAPSVCAGRSGLFSCGDAGGGELLVSTDLLTEGVHFLLDDITPWQLGWKSLAVNISDIAAMGGTPKAFFLSIAIPTSHPTPIHADHGGLTSGAGRCDKAWLDEFIRGMKSIADKYGVMLLGGDTSCSVGPLTINVTILGTSPAGRSVKRSAARPGDLVCVSGFLGDSAAGLRLIQERTAPPSEALSQIAEELVRRHYEPQPRIALGQALAAMPGIGAMMDISDGLAADLPHILEASGLGSTPPAAQVPLGASLDPSRIPLSEEMLAICREKGWEALSLALEGGEDYELLFTCRPDALLDTISGAGPSSALGKISVIGRITDTPGIVWEGTHRSFKGFRHF